MDTLAYIADKYNLNLNIRSPIEIPNVGRDNLGPLFAELGFIVGAEIGVCEGLYSEVLCKSNPKLKLFGIDAWTVYRDYRDFTSQDILENKYEKAKKRLAGYNIELIQAFSIGAAGHFPDNFLDFVYIDANHEFPFVVQDICTWSTKVRPGGIVAGHDYYRTKSKTSKCHVMAAVNAYTFAYLIHPWFLLGTKAKTPGLIRDNSRSWFWIKE